jgi:hypothetical protein
MAKLTALESSLRQAGAVDMLLLAKIEREIEGVGALTRRLRRFEEAVKRSMRVSAVRGGGTRGLIGKVRDHLCPEMRDLICRMNLLGARIQLLDLQLVRMLGSSRVLGKSSFESLEQGLPSLGEPGNIRA